MRSRSYAAPAALVLAAALAGCNLPSDSGYVEIKTVPVATSARAPALYLNSVKLDPLQKGVAVLKQRIGTVKLSIDAGAGQLAAVCEIVVRKNRITSLTISVLERPPRCQCRNSNAKHACVS